MNTWIALVAVAGLWAIAAGYVTALDSLLRWMAGRFGWKIAR